MSKTLAINLLSNLPLELFLGVYLHLKYTVQVQRELIMPRQSITLTQKNDAWLKSQIEDIEDFSNKSELINDLIRQARRADAINNKLARAERVSEEKGFVKQSAAQILAEFDADLAATK